MMPTRLRAKPVPSQSIVPSAGFSGKSYVCVVLRLILTHRPRSPDGECLLLKLHKKVQVLKVCVLATFYINSGVSNHMSFKGGGENMTKDHPLDLREPVVSIAWLPDSAGMTVSCL